MSADGHHSSAHDFIVAAESASTSGDARQTCPDLRAGLPSHRILAECTFSPTTIHLEPKRRPSTTPPMVQEARLPALHHDAHRAELTAIPEVERSDDQSRQDGMKEHRDGDHKHPLGHTATRFQAEGQIVHASCAARSPLEWPGAYNPSPVTRPAMRRSHRQSNQDPQDAVAMRQPDYQSVMELQAGTTRATPVRSATGKRSKLRLSLASNFPPTAVEPAQVALHPQAKRMYRALKRSGTPPGHLQHLGLSQKGTRRDYPCSNKSVWDFDAREYGRGLRISNRDCSANPLRSRPSTVANGQPHAGSLGTGQGVPGRQSIDQSSYTTTYAPSAHARLEASPYGSVRWMGGDWCGWRSL